MNKDRPRARRDAGQSSTVQDEGEGRSPTVLQILPRLDTRGGVERGTVEMARALADAGWGSLVASGGGGLQRQLEAAGSRHISLPLDSKNPIQMRSNIARLADLIEAEGVDIVHARSRAPAWSAWYAASRTRRHFITTFHGAYDARGAVKRRYNAIMARGERVIANSEFIGRLVANAYGVDGDRLRVIPRGVEVAMFDPKAVNQSRIVALAGRWRLPDGYRVVMLPARLTRWKGHEVLIDALVRLERADLAVLFVGDEDSHGDYRRSLERRVERLGLSQLVHFAGACNDMPAAYMLADVVVNASTKPEAFGRVIAEAQAMGRPVLASDHGAARETVIPGETGWLFAPNDPDALAEALKRALSLDAAERQRMASVAIDHIRRTFTVDRMCAQTMDVYREVLAERAPAAAA